MLARNCTLTRLSIYDNKIDNDGARALSLNTTLTELNFGGNPNDEEDSDEKVSERVAANRIAQLHRRSAFLRTIIALACHAACDCRGPSHWSRLPTDLKCEVMKHLCVDTEYSAAIGKTPRQVSECAVFLAPLLGLVDWSATN